MLFQIRCLYHLKKLHQNLKTDGNCTEFSFKSFFIRIYMYTYLNVLKKSIKTDSNGQPKNAVNLGDDLSWRLLILHSLSKTSHGFYMHVSIFLIDYSGESS